MENYNSETFEMENYSDFEMENYVTYSISAAKHVWNGDKWIVAEEKFQIQSNEYYTVLLDRLKSQDPSWSYKILE